VNANACLFKKVRVNPVRVPSKTNVTAPDTNRWLCGTSVALCVSLVILHRQTLTTEAQRSTEISPRRPCRSTSVLPKAFLNNALINLASFAARASISLADDPPAQLPCRRRCDTWYKQTPGLSSFGLTQNSKHHRRRLLG